MLRDEYGSEDHRDNADILDEWAQKSALYYQEKAAQEAEIAKFGYLKSLSADDKEEQ